MVTKHVYTIDRVTRSEIPLATFRWTFNGMSAEYHDEDYHRTLEDVGIVVVVEERSRVLLPRDGRLFFENLERAFLGSQITFVRVT